MSMQQQDIDYFLFRDLHPRVFMGTASDRYAGWIGQIYSGGKYVNRINKRPKTVGGKKYVEDVLPVESVAEYFQHFPVLELDFTFYGLLLDREGKATPTYRVLSAYCQHLKGHDRLILKVPQIIFAKKLRRGRTYEENKQYLNPEIFTNRFYEPAVGLLAPWMEGLIFEQEYQKKQDRLSVRAMADALDGFFSAIPKDMRYHMELRTESFLSEPVFRILEKHGVGQVLSHWTWLPPLARQFSFSGRRFLNAGKRAIIRLMTPRGMRYDQAYARAHPFNALVDGMLDPRMIDETTDVMKEAIARDIHINVIINNRSGGNAPLIAQRIATQFLDTLSD